VSDAPPTLRQIAAAAGRLLWAWLNLALTCALAGTSLAEGRRRRRLRELTGKQPPPRDQDRP
jgi:hypothetical protein